MLCQINQEILTASKIIATVWKLFNYCVDSSRGFFFLELFFYDFVIQVISKKTV